MSVPLLTKDLLILGLVVWASFRIFGLEARRWRDVGIFAVAALFCLTLSAVFAMFGDAEQWWRIFYLSERSWTLMGDITIFVISLGYAFGLICFCRLVRKVAGAT